MSINNSTKFAFLTENKGLGDLRSKEYTELQELLQRQDHILSNKSLINKLKDKGEKIKKVREQIAQELSFRQTANIEHSLERNSTAIEWREPKTKEENAEGEILDIEETDALKILSENGQIPKNGSSNLHVDKLLSKEKDPKFSYKPFHPAVAEKMKKVNPNAPTNTTGTSLVKTLHLNESLDLLSEQLSALKILGTRSKRAEECIQDRTNESEFEHEDCEEIDDHELEASSITVNINV